jgi:acetyl-CoA C-acetyltransferase
MSQRECFVFDAVRTPRGRGRKADGGLAELPPLELAKTALGALRDRNRLDTSLVDEVILGCVEAVGEQGADIARLAALHAGYDQRVPGVQVNRFCASGLEAVNLAAGQIRGGLCDLVVAGGVESMSRVQMGTAGGAWSTYPPLALGSYFVPQGISADLIATRQGYSRKDVDALAVESHRRAALAWAEGRFARSIAPVVDGNGSTLLDRDELVRPDATAEGLGKLKASFVEMGEKFGFDAVAMQRYPEVERLEHVHHAGNSSGIADGAAAVLLGSAEMGKRLGLAPRARIVMAASIGSEPCIMLTGPADATEKALRRAGMAIGDIDLFEVNEAFAAVPMLFMERTGAPADRVNPNGGAIAMGHPLGATGAMLLGTALDELERAGKATALVTLCVGAGMATATILERV